MISVAQMLARLHLDPIEIAALYLHLLNHGAALPRAGLKAWPQALSATDLQRHVKETLSVPLVHVVPLSYHLSQVHQCAPMVPAVCIYAVAVQLSEELKVRYI